MSPGLSWSSGDTVPIKLVRAPNTAPTSADSTVTATEDTDYAFLADRFPYMDMDAGARLVSVKIVTLPATGKGTLTLDGTALTSADLPQTVGALALDLSTLKYVPPANANGDDFTSFTFRVNDGGVDSATHTMTIDVTAVDDPATGEPEITGTPAVGEVLTATVGTIADVDGLPDPFLTNANTSFQWIQVATDNTETDISGATASTYTLLAGDLGKTIKVKVTFTDDGNTAETLTSVATAAVSAALDNTAPRVDSIVRQSPSSSPTNANSLIWRVTFSENVANVDQADFTVSGTTAALSVSEVTASTVYDVTATGGTLNDLTATVTLGFANNQNITDTATNALSDTAPTGTNHNSYVVDNTRPTVTITDVPNPSNAPFTATFTFPEPVTGFAGGDITVGNGAASAFAVTDPMTYTALITPAADGAVTVDVAADVATDVAGNGNSAAARVSSTYTMRSLSISVNNGSIAENGGTATLTVSATVAFSTDQIITLVDSGTAGLNADYTLSNSLTLTLTAGSTSVTATITAQDDNYDDDAETIVITASHDGTDFGSQTVTITDDDDAPTFSITVSDDSLSEAAEPTVTLTVSLGGSAFEYPTESISFALSGTADEKDDYDIDDLQLIIPSDATEVSTTIYIINDDIFEGDETIIITASHDGTDFGSQTITITDHDDDPNTPATGAPTITGTARVGQVLTATAGDIADVDGLPNPFLADADTTFQWVRVATDSTEESISGATASTYTLVTEDLGTKIKVEVRFTDNASTTEMRTSAATAAVSAALETTAPRVDSIERHVPASTPTNANTLIWRVTFSEPVLNVDTADFTVSGTTATVTAVSAAAGVTGAYDVTASGGNLNDRNATVTLSFAVGQNITDAASNALSDTAPTGTNHNTYVVDNTAPTLTITGVPPTSSAAFTATFTFLEAVTGFAVGDITLGNATATNFAVTSTMVYTALITPTADGAVTVDVPANAAQDLAGNGNTVATRASSTYDATPPTLTSAATNAAGTQFTLTFSENVQQTNLPLATAFTVTADGNAVTVDSVAAGAAAQNLINVSPAIYRGQTVVITYTDPSGSNDAAALQDLVGNDVASFTTDMNGVPAADNNSTVNAVPTLAAAIPNQMATTGTAFNYAFPSGTFSDANGDTLTYMATKPDNAALPTWLGFTAASRAFSGTPQAGDVATVAVKVTANDGNGGTVSDTFNIEVRSSDTTPPTVTSIERHVPASTPTNANTLIWRVTFSEPVLNVDTADFTVSGTTATVTAVSAAAGVTGAYDVTASGGNLNNRNATVTLSFVTTGHGIADTASNALTDTAPTGTNHNTYVVDNTAPTLTITGVPPTSSAAFTATFTFLEPVTGFAVGDITLGNATAANFAVTSTTVYTALITPTADGAVTVDVPANAAQDLAGNGNTVATRASSTYDATPPTLTSAASGTAGTQITLTFSENVQQTDLPLATAFTVTADGNAVTVSSVAASATNQNLINVSPAIYRGQTVVITYTDPSSGNDAAALQDLAGNDVASFTTGISSVPTAINNSTVNAVPTLATAIPNQAATTGTSFSYTFLANTFSDANGDTLTYMATKPDNAALPTWLGFTAASRAFSGTPQAGDVGTVAVKVTANDGNGGTVSDTFNIEVRSSDTTPPTVTSIERHVPASTPTNANTLIWRVTFSEPVLNVDTADFTVSGTTATVTAVSAAAGVTGAYDVTASGGNLNNRNATVTLSFVTTGHGIADTASNALTDTAPTGTNHNTYVVDNTAPTLTITGVPPTSSAAFTATFTFLEPVTGFAVGDITLGNATAANFAVTSTTVYTALITPTADGAVTVDVPANAAQDLAGNGNTVATRASSTYDATPPTLTSAASGTAGTQITLTFSENVQQTNLPLATAFTVTADGNAVTVDSVAAGAAAQNLINVSPAIYRGQTVVITYTDPSGSNDAAALQDLAGNDVASFTTDMNGVPAADNNSTVNAVPTLAAAIPNQMATTGTAFNYAFPSGTFSDANGDTLTYMATKPDNAALPTWLGFTAASRAFSGTPQAGDVGTVAVKVTANDGNGGTVSDTFNIEVRSSDTTPPTVTSIERHVPASTPTNANTLIWRVTFSEPVLNVDTADFTVSGTTATVTAVSAAAGVTGAYDVTASGGNLNDRNATVTLSFAVGQNITDAASNALSDTAPTGTNHNTYVVDNTAPTLTITGVPPTSSAAFTATFTFLEPVTGFAVGDITLGNATAANFAVTSTMVYTALITPTADGAVTVDVPANAAQDLAGNGNTVATRASSTYTLPAITIAEVTSPVTEGAAAAFTLSRTGSTTAALTVNVTVSETGDMVAPANEGARTVTFGANSATAALSVATLADSVDEADSVVTATLTADTVNNPVTYTLGTPSLATVTVSDDDETADTTPPELDSAQVDGETLTLTYNEALDTGSEPAPGDFSVSVNGNTAVVSDVALSGSALTLTLAVAVVNTDTVTVTYTAGSNPIQDLAGNDAADISFPGRAVDNVTVSAPGAPGSLAAIPGNGQVGLGWAPPSSDGGVAIVRYEYRVSRDGGNNWSPDWSAVPDGPDTGSDAADERAYLVTGLANGTAYTFEVRASNSTHSGPAAQAEATPQTGPAADPGAPRGFAARAGDAAVTLSWRAPLDTGNRPLLRYEVRHAQGSAISSSVSWQDAGTVLTYTVAGLTNGRQHTFEVRAVNTADRAGAAARAQATPEANADVPGPVRSLRAAARNFEVALYWHTPAREGLTAITHYEFRYARGSSVPTGAAWVRVHDTAGNGRAVDGLENGVAYTFEVRAVNAEGTGALAQVRATPGEPALRAPGAPGNLRAVSGAAYVDDGNGIDTVTKQAYVDVTLSWDAPTDDGDDPIFRYETRHREASTAWTAFRHVEYLSEPETTVAHLTPGARYTFELRAVNEVGPGTAASRQLTTARYTGPAVTLQAGGSAREGEPFTLRATRSGSTTADTYVFFELYDSAFPNGYRGGTPYHHVVAYFNGTTATASYTPPFDGTRAGRTFTVRISSVNQLYAISGGLVTVSVADRDAGLSVADASVREGVGATLEFVVRLDRARAGAVTVEYATSADTATAGTDYTEVSGTLSIPAGSRAASIEVPVLDDDIDDDGERLILTLSNADGAIIDDGVATGTIHNTDALPKAWLGRFGRSAAVQVVTLLDERFEAAAASDTRLVLGGRAVDVAALRTAPGEPAGRERPETGCGGGTGASQECDTAERARLPGAAGAAPGRPAGRAVRLDEQSGLFGQPGADPVRPAERIVRLDDQAGSFGQPGADPAAVPGEQTDPAGQAGEATPLERALWTLLTQRGRLQFDKRQFISQSSFELSLNDPAGPADSCAECAVMQAPDFSGRWSLWGRGALMQFSGQDNAVNVRGDVLTGLLGVDYARARWLAGAALAYHDGNGSYSSVRDGGTGALDSVLVTVNPYLRYALTERLSVWGTLGYGAGALTLRQSGGQDADAVIETDLRMGMGALGLRGVVYAGEHTEWALKSDALWVRTSSAETAGMRGAAADTSRLRLLLSGQHQRALANDALLSPGVELGLRYDDGDAETGLGLELGAGLRYADSVRGLIVETKVRALLAHEDGAYQEWGLSGSLSLDPGRLGRGLALRLDSGWGVADSGAEALWQRQTTAGIAPQHDSAAQQRITAEMGYGLEVPWTAAILTPYSGVEWAGSGRTLRLGWRFVLGQRLSLSLDGERTETGHTPAAHALMLRTSLPW